MMYEYASGDRLEERNTYFYSPFGGEAFLAEWQRSRSLVESSAPLCPRPTAPREAAMPTEGAEGLECRDLLLWLWGATSRAPSEWKPEVSVHVDLLLQRFEVTKRLYKRYRLFGGRLRADRETSYRDLELYLILAEVLLRCFQATSKLQYLNGVLKVIDTLISVRDSARPAHVSWLSGLIHEERHSVLAVAGGVGVRW